MVPAIAGYGVTLVAVVSLIGDEVDRVGEWALLMLPIVPALWGMRAVVRHLRRLDEYQRSMQLEAMAASFGVAMVTAIETGRYDPSLPLAFTISAVFGLPIEQLFFPGGSQAADGQASHASDGHEGVDTHGHP